MGKQNIVDQVFSIVYLLRLIDLESATDDPS
jgi:hypothetical protein